MAKKSKNKTTIRVDFTGVESNSLFPEIEGRFKLLEAKFVDNDGDGSVNWKWECTGAENEKYIGKTFSDRTPLSEGALWNLRNRLEALGADVPSSEQDIDLEALAGLELEASNEHRDWDGKEYNQLKNYVPVDATDKDADVKVTDKRKAKDEDDEEEAPKKKRARDEEDEPKKKSKDDDDDDEDDKPKRKPLREKDEDDEDDKPKKKRKEEDEDEPKSKKKRSDEDDEDKPKKRARDEEDEPKKKSKKKYTEDEIRDMDEEELQDIIDKHELAVKLKKIDNLRKQRIAVVDALQDEELLED